MPFLTILLVLLFIVFIVVAIMKKEYKGSAFYLHLMIGLAILDVCTNVGTNLGAA